MWDFRNSWDLDWFSLGTFRGAVLYIYVLLLNVLHIKKYLQTWFSEFSARIFHFLETFQSEKIMKISDFWNLYDLSWFSLGTFRGAFLDIYVLLLHVLHITKYCQALLDSHMKVLKVSNMIWRRFDARKLLFLKTFQSEKSWRCQIFEIFLFWIKFLWGRLGAKTAQILGMIYT